MVILLVLAIAAAVVVGFAIGWFLVNQGQSVAPDHRQELAASVDRAVEVLRNEQAESMQAAVNTILSVASSKLGDQLEAGKIVIDRERDSMSHQVETVNAELRRVSGLVADLQKESAQQAGQLTNGLEQAFRVTSTLADTTQSLERALASPKARGQWGERMAEDVLRSAGFIEGVSYAKQTKLRSGGIPDYTFFLPNEHVVHMDVKFPIDNYRRWLETTDETVKVRLAKQFQRDVRQRIKELTERDYVDPETTVDYLLLFVPNESVYGFIHEHDSTLIDVAIGQKVVLCSPVTLFAVLAVIRQSVDNFLIERRSGEIIGALGGLRDQWERWSEPMDKMGRAITTAQKAFDELSGPRTRQFERQLEKLEAVRDARVVPAESGLPTVLAAPVESMLETDFCPSTEEVGRVRPRLRTTVGVDEESALQLKLR
ncbi:MAG: DNA recombination protein RmuC [Actinomycetia bacterium]|nr:DNA recombination protein RmuC [Actinomycetes bacterium]MCP5030181.1 DNA recombination protein RmuC [Actinomycetes bacterium]